jgi:hypothetical protein
MLPLPRRRRLPLTFWAALALVGVAVIASVLWWRWEFFDQLAPNVITEALGLAVTVTAVEWIVRRQSQERLLPRTQDVLHWMGLDFRLFTMSVVHDYAVTHVGAIKPIPRDALELIDLCLEDYKNEDEPRDVLDGQWLPSLFLSALEFDRELQRARERDLDVLEPDLIAAIDKFRWHVGQAVQHLGFVREGHLAPEMAEPVAYSTLMRGTRIFAEVFKRYAPKWFVILDLPIAAAMEMRDIHIADRKQNGSVRRGDHV